MKTIRTFFRKRGAIFSKKRKKGFFPLVAGLYCSDGNTKKFNAGLLFESTAKWITVTILQSSILLSFALVIVQSLYLLNPYLLYFLYCTVLIYFPFLHPKSLLFNEKNLILHNFFSIGRSLQQLQPFLSIIQGWGVQVQEPSCFTKVTDVLNHYLFRSSRSQMFFKIGVLKNFANFTGKHLFWNLSLIKL